MTQEEPPKPANTVEDRLHIVKEIIPSVYTAENPLDTVNIRERMLVHHESKPVGLWAWSLSNDGGQVNMTNPTILQFLEHLAMDTRHWAQQEFAGIGWQFKTMI
jgi:hypothetical protein